MLSAFNELISFPSKQSYLTLELSIQPWHLALNREPRASFHRILVQMLMQRNIQPSVPKVSWGYNAFTTPLASSTINLLQPNICQNTALLFPPRSGSPHVTTVPSCRSAAKAALHGLINLGNAKEIKKKGADHKVNGTKQSEMGHP